MANTPNINLVKPFGTDKALVSVINDNSDKIDAFAGSVNTNMANTQDGFAIVVNGNNAPKAITAGQYLFIKNHSTLSAGGYHATANIANGAAITSSNVAADADGVVNGAFSALNSKITGFVNSAVIDSESKTTHSFTVPSSNRHILFGLAAAANNSFGAIIMCSSNGSVSFVELGKGSNVTLSSGTNSFTVTLSNGGGLKIVDFIAVGSTPLNVS